MGPPRGKTRTEARKTQWANPSLRELLCLRHLPCGCRCPQGTRALPLVLTGSHGMRMLKRLQWPACHMRMLHRVGATLLLNLNRGWNCLNQAGKRTKDLEGRSSFPRQGLWVRGSNRSLGRASTTGSNLGPHHPPVPASRSSSVEQG